jgi:iron complex transport system substrate-binding protein
MDAGPEQIAPLNPDLVMMKSYLKEQLGDQVEQLGIKVVYLDLETPEKISRDIQTLGQVFGNKERADQLVQLYDIAASRITDVTATISEENKPSVLLLMYSDKGGEIAFSVPPMNYLQSLLVEMAGGKTVWKDSPTEGWTVVTLEQIAAWNPDIIMVIDYKGKALEAVNTLKQDANWQLFSAVQNGKLYAFPVDFQSWDQPDTRWTLGLTWMATKIQPELFSAIKMYNEIPAFYADFYNLSNAEYKEKILPILRGDF